MAPSPSSSRLRLAELAGSLSLATDLGLGHPLEQALRSCLVSVGLGRLAGLDAGDLRVAYYLSLLRLIGCTSTAHDLAAVVGDDRVFS